MVTNKTGFIISVKFIPNYIKRDSYDVLHKTAGTKQDKLYRDITNPVEGNLSCVPSKIKIIIFSTGLYIWYLAEIVHGTLEIVGSMYCPVTISLDTWIFMYRSLVSIEFTKYEDIYVNRLFP